LQEENIFERNPVKTVFFVIVLLTIILDVSLTSFFLWRNKGGQRDPLLGIKHEVYHHTWVKNGFVETEFPIYQDGKIRIYSNSLGFRDKSSRTISLVPNDGIEKRIIFIGDSFVEGSMVNYENTFVGIIDSKLKDSIEVLNAGVGAKSPIIYWRKIKFLIEDVGLKFDELVVELDISDVRDEVFLYELTQTETVVDRATRGMSLYGNSFAVEIKKTIKYNTTFLYHFFNTLHDLIVSDQKSNFFWDEKRTVMGPWYSMLNSPEGSGMWTINKKIYNDWGEEGILEMKKYMSRLLSLTRSKNISLTVAVHPWPIQVWHEDLNSLQVQIWRDWCRANNVKFVNYFPKLIRKGLDDNEKRLVLDKYFLPGDIHFNEQGNQLIAEEFLKRYPKENQLSLN
jgi:hypothetical protein